MNITLILPFLLFLLSIVINLLIINSKFSKSDNNKNVQKRIFEKVRRAEQSLNESIVSTEEKISSQKIEVNNISNSIDMKVKELNSHSAELARLTNTLNEYRSMLAVLEVATNKTHEWVITVKNDCKKLEQLQKLIEEHEKATIDILNSYENAVEKQNKFYGDYENNLEIIKENNIKEFEDFINNFEQIFNSKLQILEQKATHTNEQAQEVKNIIDDLANQKNEFSENSKKMLLKIQEERDIKLKTLNENVINLLNEKESSYIEKIEKINENNVENYTNDLSKLNELKIKEVDNSINKVIYSLNEISKDDEFTKNKITKEKNSEENQEFINTDTKKEKENLYIPIGDEEEINID